MFTISRTKFLCFVSHCISPSQTPDRPSHDITWVGSGIVSGRNQSYHSVARGEEQLVVCSSLEPKELASYCLGLVQQVGEG